MQLVKSNLQRVTLNEAIPFSVFENQTLVYSKPHIQEITPSILIKGWSRFYRLSVITNILLFGILFYSFFFRSLSSELAKQEPMTTPKEVLPISDSLKNGNEIVDDALKLLLTEPTVDPDSIVQMKQFPNSEDGIVAKSVPEKAENTVSETIKKLENLDKKPVLKNSSKPKKLKKGPSVVLVK